MTVIPDRRLSEMIGADIGLELIINVARPRSPSGTSS